MTLTGPATMRRRSHLPTIHAQLVLPAARLNRDVLLIVSVSVFYTIIQLLFTDPGRGSLAWDESIYFSQVDPRSPATFFSAPRSRGAGLIAAPLALFTSSPFAIRVYLATVSGILLFLAFWAWRRVAGGGTAALAALLFSTLWVSVDYGSQLMPNIWSAFSSVAAVGLFLRAVREGPRLRLLAGMAFALAWVALIRAPDGFWVGVPLLAASLLVPSWRRRRVWAAIVIGLVAGVSEWVIEAFVRFGGITQRLADSATIEGGMGLMWNVGNAFRTADGPLLCRPCAVSAPSPSNVAWWLAMPLLALLATAVAARAGRLAVTALPFAVALSVSVPYLFMITYFAPRFLLPAYALLSLPIAGLLTHGLRIVRNRRTPSAFACAAVVAGLFAVHLGVQQQIQTGHARAAVEGDGQYRAVADALRRLGVEPPCLVAGNSEPIAYDADCTSTVTANLRSDSSVAWGADAVRAARHEAVAILDPPWGPPQGYVLPHWHRVRLTGSPWVSGWSAYLSPPR